MNVLFRVLCTGADLPPFMRSCQEATDDISLLLTSATCTIPICHTKIMVQTPLVMIFGQLRSVALKRDDLFCNN